ncbi:hypothetical protein ACJ4V0_15795 [Phreatobacter sp. HK31-P]
MKVRIELDPADHIILMQIVAMRAAACVVSRDRVERTPGASRYWSHAALEAERLNGIVLTGTTVFPALANPPAGSGRI